MRTKFKKQIVITILIIALLGIPLGCYLYRPPLSEITYTELLEIDDIGEVLAQRVLTYLDTNKNATIEDLIHVEGIGEKRLESIKERWK